MHSQTLAYNIRFIFRKKLWFCALVFLAFLFALPIGAGLSFQKYLYGSQTDPTIMKDLAPTLTSFFAISRRLPLPLQ